MSQPSPDDPEEAFAEYLFLCETGAAPDFDAFCGAFRGDQDALRAMHADWAGLSGVLSEGRPDSSGLDALTALREELGGRTQAGERYERREELARGGMGVILRVWDRDLARHLAMKVSLSPAERGSEALAGGASRQLGRFLAEAKITGQLDHPGVVSVHDLGVDEDGRCYFTMQLVRGVDLRAVLRQRAAGDTSWPLERLLGVMQKVCDAVGYAHAKGVIHRDLKPANIMVGRFGEVFVMDWGLARAPGEPEVRDLRLRVDSERSDEVQVRGAEGSNSPVLTMDGHVVGTPAYLSPEQAQGRVDELGPRSDVYSLGATLYHLICGTPPYVPPGEELAAQRVLLLALQGPPRPVEELCPRIAPELAAICARAMARDPLDRYASAEELGEDLRAFLEGRAVAAFGGGPLWGLRKWIRRNAALSAALAVAVVLAVSFGANEALELAQENRALLSEGVEARAGERLAIAEREVMDETSAELARNLRSSDEVLLEELRRAALELPSPGPDATARHEAWLRSARSLAGRLELHRSTHEELSLAGVEPWELQPLERLVAALGEFCAAGGLLPWVEERTRLASSLEERTVSGLEARARWAAAAESARASGRYGGLALVPQLGLLPLGSDPASGLEEFAVIGSGSLPRRTSDGALELEPESAIVLVLVPRHSFLMGAQSSDTASPNYDPAAEASEAPVHQVELAPYFIAKHELSGAQWRRLGGMPPSSPQALELPATSLSWDEADARLRGLGLRLPSEARWEAAARAGTSTPWWSGSDAASLAGLAQLDSSSATSVHAGGANAFGLVQTLGNVSEWCEGAPRTYSSAADAPANGKRVFRGGSFRGTAADARCADRFAADRELTSPTVGVRPARDYHAPGE